MYPFEIIITNRWSATQAGMLPRRIKVYFRTAEEAERYVRKLMDEATRDRGYDGRCKVLLYENGLPAKTIL